MVLVKVEWSFIPYNIVPSCELNVSSKSDMQPGLNVGVIVLDTNMVKPWHLSILEKLISFKIIFFSAQQWIVRRIRFCYVEHFRLLDVVPSITVCKSAQLKIEKEMNPYQHGFEKPKSHIILCHYYYQTCIIINM